MRNRVLGWTGLAAVLVLGGCIIVTDGGGDDGGGTYLFYEGCTGGGTCAEGTCYDITYRDPGGAGENMASMCTEACTSMSCPAGGTCLSIDGMVGALCYKQCDWTLNDCPTGFSCTPVDLTTGGWDYVCLPTIADPGIAAYESCPGSGTCAWPNTCYTITYRDPAGNVGSANQCTRECTVQEDCIGNALCLNIEMMARYMCYERCTSNADCTSGFVCETVNVAGVDEGVCLPAR